jgi:hypothetical protein
MKRFVLLLIAAAIAGFAIAYALRGLRPADGGNVFRLLPKETLAVAVVPNIPVTRAQWQSTDAYKLWHEPAVQEFVQRPLATNVPHAETTRTVGELRTLGATDVFVAVNAIESSAWKIVGGFRFKTTQQEAEKIVEHWRTDLLSRASDATHATEDYRGHRITVDTAGIVRGATAFGGGWFFAANDVERLKALLDRVDHQQKDDGSSLSNEETFVAAIRHMPRQYAALIYARPDALNGAAAEMQNALPQTALLRQLRSVCAAMWFDGGKIRDRSFAAMPKRIDAEIGKTALALGTKETWLYTAGLADLGSALLPAGGAPVGGVLQVPAATLSASGITAEDWNNAFTLDLNVLSDWPAGSRWPMIIAAIPVKDPTRAKEIGNRVAAAGQAAGWDSEEKNGVRYFTIPAGMQMLAISPTIGLSDRMLVAGLGEQSVEAAIARATAAGPGLSAVYEFKDAETQVPAAKQGFAYVDTALLYTRLDAALRPMLLMSAAFVPAIRDAVDLSKLPAAEAITKHLSPIAMSQTYAGDGYVTESIGPITFTQLAGGVAALSIGAAMLYHQQAPNGMLAQPLLNLPPTFQPPPPTAPVATASPSGTPR